MEIYIASSWKNQHAVEMLTSLLRQAGHNVLSFVENNHGENPNASESEQKSAKPVPFDEWCASADGLRSFNYDTDGAAFSDLVIYVGPSGVDAWAEVGIAYGRGVEIFGLWSKGEQSGLMRRMVKWLNDYKALLIEVETFSARFEGKLFQGPPMPEQTEGAHVYVGRNGSVCFVCGKTEMYDLHVAANGCDA